MRCGHSLIVFSWVLRKSYKIVFVIKSHVILGVLQLLQHFKDKNLSQYLKRPNSKKLPKSPFACLNSCYPHPLLNANNLPSLVIRSGHAKGNYPHLTLLEALTGTSLRVLGDDYFIIRIETIFLPEIFILGSRCWGSLLC